MRPFENKTINISAISKIRLQGLEYLLEEEQLLTIGVIFPVGRTMGCVESILPGSRILDNDFKLLIRIQHSLTDLETPTGLRRDMVGIKRYVSDRLGFGFFWRV